MKIGIIGLGLIGGSLAKAIKKYTSHQVYGYDIDKNSSSKALEQGAIDAILDLAQLEEMDLTILALKPVDAVDFAKNHGKMGRNLMDICGIKGYLSDELTELAEEKGYKYIGGHPMAGREVGGFDNSLEDLFQDRFFILVDHHGIESWILDMLEAVGFSLTHSTSHDHDRIIAYTSQLCHIASNAIVKSETSEDYLGYSADSFLDLTRVAKLDHKMWAELFLLNRENILEEVSNYIGALEEYREALEKGDKENLEKLLKEGNDQKERMNSKDR